MRERSSGSLVTTTCPARRAQTTTWALTMSLVREVASTRPVAVAPGPSSATRSVVDCRTQAREADLTRRIPMRLRKGNRGHGGAQAAFSGPRHRRQHTPVAAVERDESAGIEREARCP